MLYKNALKMAFVLQDEEGGVGDGASLCLGGLGMEGTDTNPRGY